MANWAQKLKLHHLEMLVALGEQGNLTHVARMMNITQPALSKWLSQLEDEIGITLLSGTAKDYVRLKAANCYCNMPNG
ncbi:LysR family transcriptional regulator [Escherichia coli]|nr:LysR family transcriptional regulator [Escherichia coli]